MYRFLQFVASVEWHCEFKTWHLLQFVSKQKLFIHFGEIPRLVVQFVTVVV